MLTSVVALAVALTSHELCPRGAGPLRNLDLPGGVRISGSGATWTGDTTWVGWTGAQCTAWISWRGSVRVADDERSVFPMPGAFLVVRAEAAVTREYRVVDSAGRVSESLTENGRALPIGPAEREWVATAVEEFLRRVPIAPAQRAARMLEHQGVDSLLAEAMRVPREQVRAEYLIVPLLSASVPANARADYVRTAALQLGSGSALAHFLTSVPRDWRADSVVTLRVLHAAARIEPDDDAIDVLRRTVSTGPLSGDLAEAVRSVIATLQSSETRQELTTRYFRRP